MAREELQELLEPLKALSRSSAVVEPEMFLALEEPLVRLIEVSRSSDGRAQLAKLRTISWLLLLLRRLQELSQFSESPVIHILSLVLKLTRNLCAGDSDNQDAFLEEGGVAVLASAASLLLECKHGAGDCVGLSSVKPENESMLERLKASFGSAASSPAISGQGEVPVSRPVGCLQILLQLLGNCAGRGEANRSAIWAEFFPNTLLDLAALRVKEICGPLCMLLYRSSQSSRKRCRELSQGEGAALIALLVLANYTTDGASASKEPIDWFELLVQHLCLREPLFPVLFTNLGVPGLSDKVELLHLDTEELLSACQLRLKASSPTLLQASLLYVLCDCLSRREANSVNSGVNCNENELSGIDLPMPLKSICFMVDILRWAAEAIPKDTQHSSVPILTSAPTIVQILGFVLFLLRTLCVFDMSTGVHTKVTTGLLSYGLIDLLLDSLKALGAPESHGKQSTDGMPGENKCLSNDGASRHKNPYQGYRRDIVAIIANASHQNFLVQERVREKGGLLLVLGQSAVERENPFLREWGLWATRNLLEGNEKNQEEVAGLEVKELLNLPELQKMGLQVQIDPNTRRPRLVNENSPSDMS